MKKLTIAAAALLMLTACGSSTKTGTGEVEVEGDKVTVEVTMDGDKITEISIDQTYQGSTKKTLKEDYDMKKASAIGKEWYEQVEYLEKYIVDNGLEAVTLNDEGKAEGDLASGCTISLTSIKEACEAAVSNAK